MRDIGKLCGGCFVHADSPDLDQAPYRGVIVFINYLHLCHLFLFLSSAILFGLPSLREAVLMRREAAVVHLSVWPSCIFVSANFCT